MSASSFSERSGVAAIAMRHSSKTQASAAYDKGACDRRVAAAMKVAADYSAKFTAGPSSSPSRRRRAIATDIADIKISPAMNAECERRADWGGKG